MEFALIIWAITTIIPGINVATFLALATLFGVAAVSYASGACTYDDDDRRAIWAWTTKFLLTCKKWIIFLVILAVLVPTQKSAWMIAGAGAAQAVATSDFAQEMGAEAKDMLKEMMRQGTAAMKEQAAEQVSEQVEKVKESAK